MPYRLDFVYTNGKKASLGPIQPDNPSSEYGLEDKSIERKCRQWASKLKTIDDIEDCLTVHYQ